MGRYLRKSKGVGEVAGMEMAADTRTREVADVEEAVVVKKRKIAEEDLKLSPAPELLQLENNGRNASPVKPENYVSQESCPIWSYNVDDAQASCCSSNESSQLAGEMFKFADLEEESGEIAASTCDSECGESGETPPLRELETESGKPESSAMPPEELSSHLISTLENMPSDAELQHFFTITEQTIQKKFEEKYNFDILEEKPLEGRYQWVQSFQK